MSVKPAGGESRQKIFSRIECFFFKKAKKKKKGFDVWFLNQTTWNFSVFGCFISFLMTWLHSPFLSSYQISFSSPINHQTGAFYWNKSHKSADRDSVSCLRTLQAGQSLNMNPPDEWKAVNMVNGKKQRKEIKTSSFRIMSVSAPAADSFLSSSPKMWSENTQTHILQFGSTAGCSEGGSNATSRFSPLVNQKGLRLDHYYYYYHYCMALMTHFLLTMLRK